MSTRKIRIGNDIHFRWLVRRDGEPEDFADKRVMLLLRDSFGHRCDVDWHTVGEGIIEGTCYGHTQRHLGTYTLTLVENDGEKGMNTVDSISVWQLVARQDTTLIGEPTPDDSPVKTVVAEIESDFGIGTLNVIIKVDKELDENSDNPIANRAVATRFKDVEKGMADVADEIPVPILTTDIDSLFTAGSR